MYKSDETAFDQLMIDLCLSFNRQHTVELTRVFWETLKAEPFPLIRAIANKWKASGKKFPTPSDLKPTRVDKPPEQKQDDGPPMSSWAVAANKILFACCYGDPARGMIAVGAEGMQRLLALKRDIVGRAEQSADQGDAWDTHEFNVMCREGFQKLLGST